MKNEQKVRKRAEIDPNYKWRLEDIYANDAAWEADFAAAQKAIAGLAALRDTLVAQKPSILNALAETSRMSEQVTRLLSAARMRRDEDSRQTGPQAMTDRAQTLATQAGAAMAFFRPALLEMPETLLRDCVQDPAFADYDRTLEDILRSRPHTLAAEQEALLAQTQEIGSAADTIYTLFTEADMRFGSIEGEDGAPAEVSEARFLTLLGSKHPRVRKDAYETVMNTYGSFGNTLSATYAANVKHDILQASAHRFASSIEASLFDNEIPVAVYGALLEAVQKHLPALNRYLRTKQKKLGLDTLHLWDLYVDTSSAFDIKLPYEAAYDMILDALQPLGEDYVQVLRGAKNESWVDVYENEGKHHGAYSWGVYGVHPYVLMNFEGTLDSASTLAHELGHAMHTYYSQGAQPYAKSGYTLFAAEVASTVNEILLSQHLLERYPDPAAQQSLLGALLEHFRTTVFRQTLFAAFEREAHAMQERGEALTKEALCDIYYGINERFYAESCQIDDAVRYEWMRIPHFYSSFYVYQYATGFSAAVSIARRILCEGKPAVEGYRKFLSAGGSLPPLDALRLAGVDMATPQPVEEALAWFEEILERFSAL